MNYKLKGDDVMEISPYIKSELDKFKEKDESYEDVILRLIVDLENAENMLRYFIQKM